MHGTARGDQAHGCPLKDWSHGQSSRHSYAASNLLRSYQHLLSRLEEHKLP
uniref:Pco079325 n=1 Tax=Arundo donax TaxID=35708 RepID=A0A0A9E316_ARUDO